VKTKNRSGGLADAVAKRVKPAKRDSWIDRLSPEDQASVYEIKERYRSGGYGVASAVSVARALREEAAEHGWHTVTDKEIAAWLRKN